MPESKDREECRADMGEMHTKVNKGIGLRLFLFVVFLFVTALAFNLRYTYSVDSEAASIRNLEQVEKRYQAADTAIIKQVDRVIDKIDDIQKQQSINHREVLDAIRER